MSAGISGTGGVLNGVDGTGQQTEQTQQAESSSGSGLTGGIGDSLDRNQFLEILLAQLQNQNPLKPQESGKFVDQMASLTSLEQMTQISDSLKSFQQSQRSQQFLTLLDKNVKVQTKDGNNLTGKVESVKFTGDSTSVIVGGSEVSTSEIAAISTNDGGNESS
jgi:flagellar basal-body rod modification protein FlgD